MSRVTPAEQARRQGGLRYLRPEEIRRDIARQEKLLAEMRAALLQAEMSAKIHEAMA